VSIRITRLVRGFVGVRERGARAHGCWRERLWRRDNVLFLFFFCSSSRPCAHRFTMEPDPLTPQEKLDLYAAWYRVLLAKLHTHAPAGGGLLESPVDAGLRLLAHRRSSPLSHQHIAHWDPERLDRVYSHLFSLAEEAFFERFNPTATVPYEAGARSLVRA
jgi:hypothetical protein